MSFVLILIVVALAAASSVTALVWAIKDGQFADLSAGATALFDDEVADPEPPDAFPKDTPGE